MIISNKRGAEVESLGNADTINMDIDLTDKRFIMDLFSEGIYSDAIGSLIRETVSNSLDANRESGSDNPVVVSLQQDNNFQYWFKSIDSGPGISPDRMEKVISKYFSSTKRDSNAYLGAMGLGLKSPLSYSDSFNILTVHEGTEYKYIMYKSEEGTAIDLVYSASTNNSNGTTIEVPVKSSDHSSFIKKIKEQLCYMEGVYFEVNGIENNFKIEKAKDWKYSSLNENKKLHLSLDNVYYELDFAKLGINPIQLPIALRFELADGIVPIPSRESIKYTLDAKQKINNKITAVIDDLITRYNDTTEEVESVFDIWNDLHNDYRILKLDSVFLDLASVRFIGNVKMNPFRIKGIHHLKVSTSFVGSHENTKMFYVHGKIDNGIYRTKLKDANLFLWYTLTVKNRNDPRSYYTREYGDYSYIHVDEPVDKMKIKYLSSLDKRYVLLSKNHNNRTLYGFDGYHKLLSLSTVPKKLWRTYIQEHQLLENGVLNKCIQLSSIVVPDDFIQKHKKERVITKVESTEINPRWLYELDVRVGSNYYSFKSNSPINTDSISDEVLIIYAGEKDKDLLAQICTLLAKEVGNNTIRACLLVDRDIKRIQGKENFITLSEFMNGHPLYKKAMTSLYVKRGMHSLNSDFYNWRDIIADISPFTSSIYFELSEYVKENLNHIVNWYGEPELELVNNLLLENTYWDYSLYEKINYIKSIDKSFTFFTHINNSNCINSKDRSFVIDTYKTKYPELFRSINI